MSPFPALLAGGSRSWYGSSSISEQIGTKCDAGTCSKGIVQLIVFSILNMVTDAMLIALPLPQLIKIKRPLIAKIRLIVLFLVGLTIIAVTLTRLLMNLVLLNRVGQSHNVANVELFFEAFVANAPTLYGLLHIERRQRSRHESHSYLPGAWTESKSANGEVRHTVMSRVTELNRRQPRSMLAPGNTRHGNDSDEEMMIVGITFLLSFVFAHFARLFLTKDK